MTQALTTPDLVLAALGLALLAAGALAAARFGRPEPDRSAESIAAAARALRKGK